MFPALMLAIALTGPANCGFAVPGDMQPGEAEWIGPCSANRAEGVGVLRVGHAGGKAELFFGRLHLGLPISGMLGDSEGRLNPVHSFSPRTNHSLDDNDTWHPAGQDARLWSLAAKAASVAARHYDTLGNKASADWYRARAKELALGPAE